MPKIRSNRGAHKRFRATATGKIKRKRAYHSHILTKKSSKRKRTLRSPNMVSTVDKKSIRRLLPYM